jgi:hypothetical protein
VTTLRHPSRSSCCEQVACCMPHVAGYVACCTLPVARCMLCCLLQVACRTSQVMLPLARCMPHVAGYVACCTLHAARCMLCCLLHVACCTSHAMLSVARCMLHGSARSESRRRSRSRRMCARIAPSACRPSSPVAAECGSDKNRSGTAAAAARHAAACSAARGIRVLVRFGAAAAVWHTAKRRRDRWAV